MESVQGANTEGGCVLARKLRANVIGHFRNAYQLPNSQRAIGFKISESKFSFGERSLSTKYPLKDGVGQFCAVESSDDNTRTRRHSPIHFHRMGIGEIARKKKAGIGIDHQYRLSSRASNTAFESKTLSPKIRRRRAAASGHSTGGCPGCSGTIRARTCSRSRSSTVSPALSQILSCFVFRSSRRFTECIEPMCHNFVSQVKMHPAVSKQVVCKVPATFW